MNRKIICNVAAWILVLVFCMSMVFALGNRFETIRSEWFDLWYLSGQSAWYKSALSEAFLCSHPEYSQIEEVNIWISDNWLDCDRMYNLLDDLNYEILKSLDAK